jgi:hypothetical protein
MSDDFSIKRLCDGEEVTTSSSINYVERVANKGKSPKLTLTVICNKAEQKLIESFLGFVCEVKYKDRYDWKTPQKFAHARVVEVNKNSYDTELVLLEFDTILNALKAAGYDHTRMEAEDEKA